MNTPGFPVLIIALIPLRWIILPKIFSAKELSVMDAPTADNAIVLASLGGMPRMRGDGSDEDDKGPSTSPGSYANGSGSDTVTAVEDDKEDAWSAPVRGLPGEREGVRERVGRGEV